MRVHAVDHPGSRQHVTKLDQVRGPIRQPKGDVARVDELTRTEAARVTNVAGKGGDMAPGQPTDRADNVPGVIRLLEAGHFKGVADVRLRINFFDQLSSRAAAQAGPVVEEKSQDLTATVMAKVDELISSLSTDEETREGIGRLVSEFEDSVQAAVDDATSGAMINTEALANALEAAFGVLVERMSELLTTANTQDETPDEPDVSVTTMDLTGRGSRVDPVSGGKTVVGPAAGRIDLVDASRTTATDQHTERPTPNLRDAVNTADVEPMDALDTAVPAPDGVTDIPHTDPILTVDEAIASLTEVFQDALADLLASIESAIRLPDPSPPNGNGVAYDKFLAIYDELRGITTTIDAQA